MYVEMPSKNGLQRHQEREKGRVSLGAICDDVVYMCRRSLSATSESMIEISFNTYK
jgi:hypothetical protein